MKSYGDLFFRCCCHSSYGSKRCYNELLLWNQFDRSHTILLFWRLKSIHKCGLANRFRAWGELLLFICILIFEQTCHKYCAIFNIYTFVHMWATLISAHCFQYQKFTCNGFSHSGSQPVLLISLNLNLLVLNKCEAK